MGNLLLLPETEVREPGTGSPSDLGEIRPDQLLITLGITHSIERQSLDLVIQGSEDGVQWLPEPLVSFSKKFYCGTYRIFVDLREHPMVRHLRPKWTLSRWALGSKDPLFGIYLTAQIEQPMAAMARGAA
jgi:hypothetical protein